MKLMKRMGTLAFVAMLGVPASVLAQQPGPGMMKQDHEMGERQQKGMGGMGMMEMCQKMQGMAGDSKMMEGMKGQHQLISEMKKHMREINKHMRMLDEMMDGMMDAMMMQRQQGMASPGSGSEQQEHHPGEGK